MAPRPPSRHGLWLGRIGWLVLIWTASVTVLAIVAVLFRILMHLAGLTV
jgi:hypothetical protein